MIRVASRDVGSDSIGCHVALWPMAMCGSVCPLYTHGPRATADRCDITLYGIRPPGDVRVRPTRTPVRPPVELPLRITRATVVRGRTRLSGRYASRTSSRARLSVPAHTRTQPAVTRQKRTFSAQRPRFFLDRTPCHCAHSASVLAPHLEQNSLPVAAKKPHLAAHLVGAAGAAVDGEAKEGATPNKSCPP